MRRELPARWHVFTGRKLSGARRTTLISWWSVSARSSSLDEKHWGPRIQLGDQFWRVKSEDRRNPLDRPNALARVLAGQFRDRVRGYQSAIRGRRIVTAAWILPDDSVEPGI